MIQLRFRIQRNLMKMCEYKDVRGPIDDQVGLVNLSQEKMISTNNHYGKNLYYDIKPWPQSYLVLFNRISETIANSQTGKVDLNEPIVRNSFIFQSSVLVLCPYLVRNCWRVMSTVATVRELACVKKRKVNRWSLRMLREVQWKKINSDMWMKKSSGKAMKPKIRKK